MRITRSFDAFDWYFLAADGRLFSTAHLALVDADDPTFLAWCDDGGQHRPDGSPWPPSDWPRDDAGAQTMAALATRLAKEGLFIDLPSLQASLAAAVDDAAEACRLRFITGGAGQAMVYLQKQTQAAQALADPSPTAARYPLLAAEVGVTVDPQTKALAADVVGVARAIAATVQAWLPVAAAIEGARLKGKAAVAAAATPAEARVAFEAVAWPDLAVKAA